VQCQGNTGGICTPTEAVFVGIDIATHAVTTPGPDNAPTSCYNCMWRAFCIDSNVLHSANQECGDFPGAFTAGNGFTGQEPDICLATLQCVLGPTGAKCENTPQSIGVVDCYCGTDGTSAPVDALFCGQHPIALNGPCLVPEANGFTFPQTDTYDIMLNYVDTSGLQPSGIANALVTCGQENACTGCFP
jgi:hypothetical protein